MFRPIIVDVVDSQEKRLGFSTTGTLISVMRQHFRSVSDVPIFRPQQGLLMISYVLTSRDITNDLLVAHMAAMPMSPPGV